MFNLDLELQKKYISPIDNNRNRYIGAEFEIPIVNLNKLPVDYNNIHEMVKKFAKHFNFTPIHLDDDGNAYSLQSQPTGDNLSFDFCYSNLELSMGKEVDLHTINSRFIEYYTYIQECLKPYNYTLTGMGVNPHYKINTNIPIQSGRYQMLYNYLNSYQSYTHVKKCHPLATYGAFTSASQVQLDVNQDNVVEVINTFNRLEPFKTVLFANSYAEDYPNMLCTRDMFWFDSMHGYNPHNVGIHEYEFQDVDDLVEYIKGCSMYCVERGEHYAYFTPIPVREYFKQSIIHGQYYQDGTLHTLDITPQPSDLTYLRTFKFQDLTYRGTVEFRSSCCQPISDTMSVSALHVGLMENLSELTELLAQDNSLYHHGYSTIELRNLLNLKTIPSFIDRRLLSNTLVQILDIAKDGLSQRGYYEDTFLEPLYVRAENLTNPARELTNGLDSGYPIEHYIKKYATVKPRKEVLKHG